MLLNSIVKLWININFYKVEQDHDTLVYYIEKISLEKDEHTATSLCVSESSECSNRTEPHKQTWQTIWTSKYGLEKGMQLISTIENLRTETTRALTNCITGRQHEDWNVANCAIRSDIPTNNPFSKC